jgi:hypothetical protein
MNDLRQSGDLTLKSWAPQGARVGSMRTANPAVSGIVLSNPIPNCNILWSLCCPIVAPFQPKQIQK